jgi:gliding motility-associated lipoprotein GldH
LIALNKVEVDVEIRINHNKEIKTAPKVKINLRTTIKIRIGIEIENLKIMRGSGVFIMLILILVSCDSRTILGETESLPGVWNKDTEVIFDLPQMDSLKKYNVFLHVRNSNEYKFNNLFLIVSMKFPHGKTIIDTLEYRMANPDGTWLGEGIGSIKENKLWYKEKVSFFEEGTYTITIAQAVRNNGDVDGVSNLEGITDVGFSVEEASQQ